MNWTEQDTVVGATEEEVDAAQFANDDELMRYVLGKAILISDPETIFWLGMVKFNS